MKYDVEPLETGIWLAQLRKLALSPSWEGADLVALLRRSFHLALLTPRPLRHLVGCNVAETEFEQLLERRALLPAALSLLGGSINYSLAPMDSEGKIEAEVWFSNEGEGGIARASSAPSAVLKAWLECLIGLAGAADVKEAVPSLPARRKYLSARRPRLTER